MDKNISTSNGVASLVTGLLSVLLVLVPYLGLPLAIIAVIYSGLQDRIQTTGISIAGKVLGIIGIVFNMLALIGLVLYVATIWNI